MSEPSNTTRWQALDALRCCAVLLMVQGHTFFELLGPATKAQEWYRLHERVHGLTAPMFLFASGLAFGVTTLSKLEAHTKLGSAFYKRMRKYALLIAIGYALQLPGQSLIAPLTEGRLLTPSVLRIGPLHLLGLMLACCQALIVVCRRRRSFEVAITALFVLVLCGAPWVWQSKLSAGLPLFLGIWLDAAHGSVFPIFPWAAFVLAGILVAAAITPRAPAASGPAPKAGFAHTLGRTALWLAASALALVTLAPRLWYGGYGPDAWADWQTSPFFVLERLGYVIAALAALSAFEARFQWKSQPQGFMALISRRSLVAYVTHLLLLYGTPFSPNLAARVGPTLSLEACALASAAVIAATVFSAWAWDSFDTPVRAASMRRVQVSLAGLALYCLVARDAFGMIQMGLVNP